MSRYISGYNRLLIAISLFLPIVLFNPIVIGKLFTVDGVISNDLLRLTLWLATAFFIIIFILFVKSPERFLRYSKLNYKNFILLFSVIITLLIISEFGLRVISGFQKQKVYYVHSYEFDYTFTKNSQGFRDREFTRHKNKDTLRIFLIGDSFIEGVVQEEYCIDRLLEKRYADSRLNREVYNLGISGNGLPTYVNIARRFKEFNPDIIILSLSIDTDIELGEDYSIYTDNKPTNIPGFYRKRIRNYLYNLFSSLEIVKLSDRFLSKIYKNYVYTLIKKYNTDNFYKILAYTDNINPWIIQRGILVGDNQEYYNRLVERFNIDPTTKKYILQIREIYKDIPFILLINPSKHQVNVKYFDTMRKLGYAYKENKVIDRKIQDAIISWAAKNNIDYLDILPFMLHSNESLFYEIDIHYNPEGNRLVAEKIYDKLSKIQLNQ